MIVFLYLLNYAFCSATERPTEKIYRKDAPRFEKSAQKKSNFCIYRVTLVLIKRNIYENIIGGEISFLMVPYPSSIPV